MPFDFVHTLPPRGWMTRYKRISARLLTPYSRFHETPSPPLISLVSLQRMYSRAWEFLSHTRGADFHFQSTLLFPCSPYRSYMEGYLNQKSLGHHFLKKYLLSMSITALKDSTFNAGTKCSNNISVHMLPKYLPTKLLDSICPNNKIHKFSPNTQYMHNTLFRTFFDSHPFNCKAVHSTMNCSGT